MRSLYVPGLEAHEYFPGVEAVQLVTGLGKEDFDEFAQGLVIPEHVDMSGEATDERPAEPLGSTISMQRSPDSPREPWAPDHHWHTDRAYWGSNQFATLLYAQELAGEVAGTELIDNTLLLEAIERDMPDTTELLRGATSVFSVAKYYAEVLPAKGSEDAIARTIESKGCETLEEVVAKESEKYKPKRFPTLPSHPFREEDTIMIDEARIVDIEDTDLEPVEAQALIAKIIGDYLALSADELAERPYYANHEWEPGHLLVMPQIGAIHRASPSPEGELKRNTLRLFVH